MILANEYNTFQLKRQEKLDIALVPTQASKLVTHESIRWNMAYNVQTDNTPLVP